MVEDVANTKDIRLSKKDFNIIIESLKNNMKGESITVEGLREYVELLLEQEYSKGA